jgi:hypothetical protein
MRTQRFIQAHFVVVEEHCKLSNRMVLTQPGNCSQFAETPARDEMSEAEPGWMKLVATPNPFRTVGMGHRQEWKAAWSALGERHPKMALAP